MEEGWEQINRSITTIGAEIHEFSSMASGITERIDNLGRNPDKNSARQLRTLVIRFAQGLREKAYSLHSQNEKYSAELERLRASMEAVMRAQDPHTDEERARLNRSLSELDALEDSIEDALIGISGMTDALRKAPSVERNFGRARDQMVGQCQLLTNNLEKTKSMVTHVKKMGYQKLNG